MPTIPITAPKWRQPKDYEEALEHTMIFGSKSGIDIGMVVSNTAPFNYTGFPAISVPCGKSNGLPIGMMLVAPYFREDVLFQAAYAYEQSASPGGPRSGTGCCNRVTADRLGPNTTQPGNCKFTSLRTYNFERRRRLKYAKGLNSKSCDCYFAQPGR